MEDHVGHSPMLTRDLADQSLPGARGPHPWECLGNVRLDQCSVDGTEPTEVGEPEFAGYLRRGDLVEEIQVDVNGRPRLSTVS
ncbi:MAG TPA: hypothetical protein PLV77_10300, partial [Solirubrobacterales bacterium]|nr:hypothetical protein [Solirubrobacterales bacterium]